MAGHGGFDPAGSRVLVTGASSGLGAELARGFATHGATVGICGRREDRLAEVLGELQEHSPGSRSWTVDLADLDAVDHLAADVVEAFGGLDVLVNNAGIPKRRWAWEHRPDEVTDVLRINVESPIRLTLALLGVLAGSRGHVVFVGSVAARLDPPAEAVYSASKAAVTTFAECLRVDLAVAGAGVGVHVVQPGVLDTELFAHPDNDESFSGIEALPATAIVEPVMELLATGAFETYVPADFADIAGIRAGDPEGFMDGAAEFAAQRLTDLGVGRPQPPGGRP